MRRPDAPGGGRAGGAAVGQHQCRTARPAERIGDAELASPPASPYPGVLRRRKRPRGAAAHRSGKNGSRLCPARRKLARSPVRWAWRGLAAGKTSPTSPRAREVEIRHLHAIPHRLCPMIDRRPQNAGHAPVTFRCGEGGQRRQTREIGAGSPPANTCSSGHGTRPGSASPGRSGARRGDPTRGPASIRPSTTCGGQPARVAASTMLADRARNSAFDAGESPEIKVVCGDQALSSACPRAAPRALFSGRTGAPCGRHRLRPTCAYTRERVLGFFDSTTSPRTSCCRASATSTRRSCAEVERLFGGDWARKPLPFPAGAARPGRACVALTTEDVKRAPPIRVPDPRRRWARHRRARRAGDGARPGRRPRLVEVRRSALACDVNAWRGPRATRAVRPSIVGTGETLEAALRETARVMKAMTVTPPTSLRGRDGGEHVARGRGRVPARRCYRGWRASSATTSRWPAGSSARRRYYEAVSR